MNTYAIANWKSQFETSETAKLKTMRWVPVPNQHDGLAFRRLTAHPQAVQLFAAWNLILQVASRGDARGVLQHNGQPLDARDLALMTGFPEEIFTLALRELASQRIGWLVCHDDGQNPEKPPQKPVSPGTPAASPGIPAEPAGTPGASPSEGRKEGRKGGTSGGGPGTAGPLSPPTPPIQFFPVKPGLYRREYQAMLEDCEREIERVTSADASYERLLKADVVDLIALLEKEGNTRRAEEIRRRSDTWRRGPLKPQAGALLLAWKQRRTEIKAAMNGVVAAEPSR
jgi:hypothetical protein